MVGNLQHEGPVTGKPVAVKPVTGPSDSRIPENESKNSLTVELFLPFSLMGAAFMQPLILRVCVCVYVQHGTEEVTSEEEEEEEMGEVEFFLISKTNDF